MASLMTLSFIGLTPKIGDGSESDPVAITTLLCRFLSRRLVVPPNGWKQNDVTGIAS